MTYRAPRIFRTAKMLMAAFALSGLVFMSATSTHSAPKTFWAFETGPVRPMAIADDGSKLFVVNIPDHRLEIFALSATAGPTLIDTVDVGLEPSSAAVRNASEVWVVKNLLDSVSIVDVASSPPRVTRTLLVGDEPRDIVFAGAAGERACITTAHRGQHHPADPLFRGGGGGGGGGGRMAQNFLSRPTDQVRSACLIPPSSMRIRKRPESGVVAADLADDYTSLEVIA